MFFMCNKGVLKTVRIDSEKFREYTCKKCKHYANDKPVFGKCFGDRMYSCARMRMFNSKEFENYTGINLNRRYKEDGIKDND